ncbi:MAG TPA: hypothetical protein VD813_01440 [Pseudonocardia sp.]|nr:hypothetical protein [Pseudonocardia sp.]
MAAHRVPEPARPDLAALGLDAEQEAAAVRVLNAAPAAGYPPSNVPLSGS